MKPKGFLKDAAHLPRPKKRPLEEKSFKNEPETREPKYVMKISRLFSSTRLILSCSLLRCLSNILFNSLLFSCIKLMIICSFLLGFGLMLNKRNFKSFEPLTPL